MRSERMSTGKSTHEGVRCDTWGCRSMVSRCIAQGRAESTPWGQVLPWLLTWNWVVDFKLIWVKFSIAWDKSILKDPYIQGLCKIGSHYPAINILQPTLFKQPKSSNPVHLGLSVSDLYIWKSQLWKLGFSLNLGSFIPFPGHGLGNTLINLWMRT